MRKVTIYEPSYNETLRDVLRDFSAGIPGAKIKKQEDFIPCDEIAVIFGWYKTAYPPTMTKKPIIDYHVPRGTLMVLESAFLKRKQFYQIGWNGFAGFADFRNQGKPLDRWIGLGVDAKPWKTDRGGLIVVIGQLPRDTQVQDVDHVAWCQRTFEDCQKRFGNDRVVFRPHPCCEDGSICGIGGEHWDCRKLPKVLDDASLMVTWNSTTGVEAAVHGVPVVAMNRGAMAWPVASQSIDEPFRTPDRVEWLAGIGYAQWTRDEMRAGLPWRHLTGAE